MDGGAGSKCGAEGLRLSANDTVGCCAGRLGAVDAGCCCCCCCACWNCGGCTSATAAAEDNTASSYSRSGEYTDGDDSAENDDTVETVVSGAANVAGAEGMDTALGVVFWDAPGVVGDVYDTPVRSFSSSRANSAFRKRKSANALLIMDTSASTGGDGTGTLAGLGTDALDVVVGDCALPGPVCRPKVASEGIGGVAVGTPAGPWAALPGCAIADTEGTPELARLEDEPIGAGDGVTVPKPTPEITEDVKDPGVGPAAEPMLTDAVTPVPATARCQPFQH